MRNRMTRASHTDTDLAALLRAADAPPSDHELAGLPAALNAFRAATATALTGPAVAARGTRVGARITSKVAKIAIAVVGIAFAGGVSYAAAGGSLAWLHPSRVESPAVPPAEPAGLLPAGTSVEHTRNQPPATGVKDLPRTSSIAPKSTRPAVRSGTITATPIPTLTQGLAPGTTAVDPVGQPSDGTTTATADGDDAPHAVGPNDSAGVLTAADDTLSRDSSSTTAGRGPEASALPGLCTAWRAQQQSGAAHGASTHTPAAAALVAAAGSPDDIGAFCDDLVGPATAHTAVPTTPPLTTTVDSAPGNRGGKGNGGNAGSNGQGNGGNAGSNGQGNGGNAGSNGQGHGNGQSGSNGQGNGNGGSGGRPNG